MSIDYNQCQYLNAEKDNASSMLKKCINGNDDLAWPCISRELFDSNILNYNTERPNGDNVGVKLPHTLHNKVDDIDDYDTNKDKETSINKIPIPEPGVPSKIVCGGYSVHPAPVGPPGTKKLAIKTPTAIKNIQKLIMLT